MARDTSDLTPITRDDLARRLESGGKPPSAWRIGTEHEKFGFHRADLAPVSYDGPHGVRQLLEGVAGLLGWEPIVDFGNIIGLLDPIGGGAISLEPGGQFELSGAPVETIHQTCREVNAHLAQLREIANPLGLGFLGIGFSPKWSLADTPVMPKQRYAIMMRHMPKVGSRGLDMMFRTSAVQVNLDFADEADMVRKMRVGLALQPIATAIFANSPFRDGRATGLLSERAAVWRDTDSARCGALPWAFQPGFGFEAYVDWALDVPMYFVRRDGLYHDATDVTFRQYLGGALRDRLPGVVPTMGDWDNHLSTLFPDVRLKQFLEMRGADSGSLAMISAVPAFWAGLLYDTTALTEATDLVSDWTEADRAALAARVPHTALKTPFRGGTVLDVARTALRTAHGGLTRRGRLDVQGRDETVHLRPLEAILATGQTAAEVTLRRYRHEWAGDLDHVFAAHAL